VVQTITSSIVNMTGSNIFGSQLTDRQTFTGSLNVTGSQTVFGNLGVGGAAGEKFAVTGPLGLQGFIRWSDGVTTSAFLGITGSTAFIHGNNFSLGLGANGSNNYSPTIMISGSNVGIGTTSPIGALHIKAGANTQYGVYDSPTSGYGYQEYRHNGTTYGYIGQGSALVSAGSPTDMAISYINNLAFSSGASTERMRITGSSGNVMIAGSTDYGQKLQVMGSTLITNGYTNFQQSTKTAASAANTTFTMGGDYGQATINDNIGGLVVINISQANTNIALGNGVWVGTVINPRGTSATVTQISKTLGGGVTALTVSASGNNIVVNATISDGSSYRASMTFIGGAGTS